MIPDWVEERNPTRVYQQIWTVGNKLESVTWEDREWSCKVAFGYDGEGMRLWKREYLPRPLGGAVDLVCGLWV